MTRSRMSITLAALLVTALLSGCADDSGASVADGGVGGDGGETITEPPSASEEATASDGSRASPSDGSEASASDGASVPEVDRFTELAELLGDSPLEPALAVWGRQAVPSGVEIEHYQRLEDMAGRASVAVVGRILGEGPSRTVHGDPGTGDELTYPSTHVEVIEVLAGTRDVEVGDELVVESLGVPDADEAAGTTAVLFLRHKQDTIRGEPDPDALPGEAGLWRLVSHQGVFVDRGDGVPVNPISEATLLIEHDIDEPLEQFVYRDDVPGHGRPPLMQQARELTMRELLALVTDVGTSR